MVTTNPFNTLTAQRDSAVKGLRDVERVLSNPDPTKFSAEDERRRIASALFIVARALQQLPGVLK